MFKRLQTKWGVDGIGFVLIFCTFALGGSLCGFLGRKFLLLTGLEKNFIWWILYILLVTLLWPLCVLAVSVFTGQFNFFKNYIQKIFKRMGGK